MKKLDLTKEYRAYYTARTTPELVEIGEGKFLTIPGKGAPGGEEFQAKVSALYSLAYGIKMLSKREGRDFVVAKLEALWWVESEEPWFRVPREEWRWKLLLRQPDFVDADFVEEARRGVLEKKRLELVNAVEFEKWKEGKCVQVLHIGPYSAEPESIAKMEAFMAENGLVKNGPHHEIYLVMSYPRRVPEERLRTILRQPVREEKRVKKTVG